MPLSLMVIIFCPALLAASDGVSFRAISIQQGLSQSSAMCAVRDADGFLWVGTQDGLNRYDGYGFTVFRNDPQNPDSLSENWITSLFVDGKNRLWVGTFETGLNRYNKDTGCFTRYGEATSQLPSDEVFALYGDRSGVMWIATAQGVCRYVEDQDQFAPLPLQPQRVRGSRQARALTLFEDSSGALWVGTHNGLYRHSPSKDQVDYYGHHPEGGPGNLSESRVLAIAEEDSGKLWVGTRNGLNLLDPQTGEITQFHHDPNDPKSLSHNIITALFVDDSGLLWVGTPGGLNLFRPDKGFRQIYHNPLDQASPSSDYIACFYRDKTGALWMGTEDGGLNLYDPSLPRFVHVSRKTLAMEGLSHNSVKAFAPSADGSLWIGTDGGVSRYHPQNQRYTYLFHRPNTDQGLLSDGVRAVLEDGQGRVWVGGLGGLTRYDPARDTYTHYQTDPDNPQSLMVNLVGVIAQDSAGQIWLGTTIGFERYDGDTDGFVHYRPDPDNPEGLSNGDICFIQEDLQNRDSLFVGTYSGGLNKLHIPTGRFGRFVHNPQDPNTLRHNCVLSICQSEQDPDVIWFGTRNGLSKFSRKTETFHTYGLSQGLPNNTVYGVLEDRRGQVWCSTNGGLCVLNPQTEQIRTFDFRDGLQSNEFNAGAYLKTAQGLMYFGGVNGFNAFNPDHFQVDQRPAPVVITRVLENGKPFHPQAVNPDDPPCDAASVFPKITLRHNRKNIAFEFSSLDLSAPWRNSYQYKMEGFDNHWIETDADQRRVGYSNLSAGTYQFRVKGSNRDGYMNPQEAHLTVTVTAPLWARWWAKLLYGLLGAAVLIWYIRLHKHELEQQRKIALQERELAERDRQAAARLEELVAHRTQDLSAKNTQLETVNREMDEARQQLETQANKLKQQAERLKEMDEMKTRFFTGVSHEFRTPLTLIMGPLEQMLEKMKGESDARSIESMLFQARKLLKLINQLLDISKFEAGSMELQVRRGDVVAFVRDMVLSFTPWADKKKIALSFQGPETQEADFDPDKLEKILDNLLGNAFKFTPENGKIRVVLSSDRESEFQISVKDTGAGIVPDRIPFLFNRFYHAQTGEANPDAMGIGLSLVKDLIVCHGGDISVHSDPGFGSEFKVVLPLFQGEGAQPAGLDWRPNPQRAPELAGPNLSLNQDIGGERETLLIIEDHGDVRTFLREQLSPHYKILEAGDGAQGLELARNSDPQLIISDVMMPGLDGFQLCRQLKEDLESSHIPILLLTARAGEESRLRGLQFGADDYLVKPFSLRELKARVRNLLNSRKKLRARFSRELILEPAKIAVTPPDERFLAAAMAVMEAHIENSRFGVEDFASEMAVSSRQLQRKLNALTGLGPGAFIRQFRLKRAAYLLEQGMGAVSEVVYAVGFRNAQHFATLFRKTFGKTPGEYAKAAVREKA